MPGDVLISRVPHNQPVLELAEGILALREAVTAAESCGDRLASVQQHVQGLVYLAGVCFISPDWQIQNAERSGSPTLQTFQLEELGFRNIEHVPAGL